MTQPFTFLDMFCGAGGLSRGLLNTGVYHHLLGVDFNADAVATYRENIGDGWCVDLKRASTLRTLASDYAGMVDVLAGGVPCQPFSEAGRKKGERDERNGWPIFLLALRKLQPRAFIAENVARLTHEPCRPYLDSLLASMRHLGYTVAWRVLDAADYGVPQHRKRVFIVGFLDKRATARFQWPLPTHSAMGSLWTAPHVGAGVVLLPRLTRRAPDPKGLPNWLRCAEERDGVNLVRGVGVGGTWGQANMRHGAALHDGKGHRRYAGERSYGANWQSLSLPAFTITASAGISHRVQVGDDVWKLDCGDLAALQAFPDDYRWLARNVTSHAALVGNAVPPPLGRAVGEAVAHAMGVERMEATA